MTAQPERICQRCSVPMAAGLIPDLKMAHHHSAIWIESPPADDLHTTKPLPSVDRSSGIPVVAYRCVRCGVIELVARSATVDNSIQ